MLLASALEMCQPYIQQPSVVGSEKKNTFSCIDRGPGRSLPEARTITQWAVGILVVSSFIGGSCAILSHETS